MPEAGSYRLRSSAVRLLPLFAFPRLCLQIHSPHARAASPKQPPAAALPAGILLPSPLLWSPPSSSFHALLVALPASLPQGTWGSWTGWT